MTDVFAPPTMRIPGTTQRGEESLPERCTKCGHPWTKVTSREARCVICGTICYRLVGVATLNPNPTYPTHHKVKPN